MTTLIITTEVNKDTVDGFSHHFSRNNIDYSVLIENDCVNIWKTNNQRGTVSNDCFWNGVNNQGKPMAKFLKNVMQLIQL